MRSPSLALVALSLCASAPPQDPGSKLDPGLRRAAGPQRAVVRLAPGAALPAVEGVEFGGRVGDVVTARGTPEAFEALARRGAVARIERARRVFLRNDFAHGSTIAFRGSISAAETDSYSLPGVAGETVRIRASAEAGSLDTQLAASDTASTGDDNGPGTDAELTVTWASTGAKTIDVSATAGTGAYLLQITSTRPLTAADLTGGDIGATTPFFAGTRAREARTIEGVDGTTAVVGVVDSGIDFAHADFRDAGGATRILALWDQTLTAEPDEKAPSGFGYGVEYVKAQIDDHLSGFNPGYVRQKDTDGHGTHVAGIAAGDGSSSGAGHAGAAPDARLIVVKFDDSSTGIIDGISYILQAAEKLEHTGVVINLSLGTHDGPHDGTSALDQAIDAAVSRGHYVVVAAGNEGGTVVHARKAIAATYTFTFTPSSAAAPGSDPHILDFWGDGKDAYTVTVSTAGGPTVTATTGTSATGGTTQTATIDNKTDAPSNGATHARVEINNLVAFVPWTVQFTRTTSDGSGVVDGWVGSETGTFAGADIAANADGSIPGTVGEPGTASQAITIGAYRGKFSWDNPTPGTTIKGDGIGASVAGNLAAFSSRGPTRDGRQKPDLAAPGAYLASARSADSTPAAAENDADGAHTHLQGTSMAAPAVAGILALLLDKNKLIDNDTVKATLAASALVDAFVTPGDGWGAGKVEATALLGSVPVQVDVIAKAGSCLKGAGGGSALPALCLLLALALVAARRAR